MGSLFFGAFLIVLALVTMVVSFPKEIARLKKFIVGALVSFGSVVALLGGMAYNDAGYCQHTRTIFGSETSTCETGWYFLGWGASTAWPHYITVSHTADMDAEGTNINLPYRIRTADNWGATITQTTRYGIPQDAAQFLAMARDFRTPERLITTTLRPAVTSSLDSVANLYTMEGYYAGGQRDDFRNAFERAVQLGRPLVERVEEFASSGISPSGATPNDLAATEDGGSVGDLQQRVMIMQPILDSDGNEIRRPHGYMEYGISVSQVVLENLDPDDEFERQIESRRQAASRRIVAQEERREQEEQRLLAIQRGQTEIAVRQAAAEVEQIEATTNAETQRQLALIGANQRREEAAIARETAAIQLEQARIEAEAQEVRADAEAYERQVILEADGALAQRLEAYVETQVAWARAAAEINVPSTVFAGGGESNAGSALGTVEEFMQIMTLQAAQQIGVNLELRTE